MSRQEFVQFLFHCVAASVNIVSTFAVIVIILEVIKRVRR